MSSEAQRKKDLQILFPTGDFPSVNLRDSKRARYLRVKVSLRRGIEVVIPQGTPWSQVKTFLTKKKDWIHSNWEKMEDKKDLYGSEFTDPFPDYISLPAIDQTWWLTYDSTGSERISVTEAEPFQLILQGNTSREKLVAKALRRWLQQKGKEHLVPWLKKVSEKTNLSYTRVSIRKQKTRWGSCSSRGSISLNCKLLFLPSHLVRYVLIHELCHTVHLNHSPKYWALVKEFIPHVDEYEEELNRAERRVPLWAESG